MPIDEGDLIASGDIVKVDSGDLEPSTSVQVPRAWVQGEEPSLYEKFIKIFDDPVKESTKAVNALVNANTFKISPSQAYEHEKELNKVVAGAVAPKPARAYEAFAAGYESSVPGMIYRQKLPGDFKPLGTYEELMFSIGNMLPSIPIWQAGFLLGGANPVTGFGGSVALEMGLRQVYTDMLRDGKAETFSDFWQRLGSAVSETAKGEVIGGLAGKAGSMIPNKPLLKMAAEMGTLTTVGSLIEGRMPEKKDYFHTAAMVGILHGTGVATGALKGRLFDLYKKRNLHPSDVENEINIRMKEAELRPITDVLKVVDLVPDGDGFRYEPKKEFFKSKTVEPLKTSIVDFRKEALDGITARRQEHDEAIAEMFRTDPKKAVEEWNASQKTEAVGRILTDLEMENLEFDQWHKKSFGQKYDNAEKQAERKAIVEQDKIDLGLAPESSQKTPSPVSSAGTSETPGQVPIAEAAKPGAGKGGEVVVQQVKPILSRASLNDDTIYLSFDKAGKIPTKAELKEMFPGAEVIGQKGIVSTTGNFESFRLDVFDGDKLSAKKAKELYDKALGGLPERFVRQTEAELAIPLEERFGTVVKYAQDESMKTKRVIREDDILAKPTDTSVPKGKKPDILQGEAETPKPEGKAEAVKTRKQETEQRWLIDAKTGDVLSESNTPAEGQWQPSVDANDFTKYLDREIIDRHTHPDNSYPSDADWAMLGWSHVKEVQSVLQNGQTVTLKKPEGWKYQTPRQLKDTWANIENEIFDSGRSKALTVEEIIQEINQKMSKETGVVVTSSATPTAPKPGKAASPDAPTRDFSEKTGKGKGERTGIDILEDLNTSLGEKAGLTIEDVAESGKRKRAIERLKKDVRNFADKAASLDMDLPDYLKEVGFDDSMIKKIRAINKIEKRKIDPRELYQFQTDALMADMELPEYLKSLGYSDKAIEKAMRPKAERVEEIQPAVAPEGETIIKQRNLGTKEKPLYAPVVTDKNLEGLKAIENYAEGSWENPIYMFRTLGDWAKENFYNPMKVAEDTAKRHFLKLKEDVDTMFKGLPEGSSERIGAYAISKQDKGEFLLKHKGIKEVPKLTDTEMVVYNKLREHYKALYEQTQEARIASGKEPFPEVEDYFTFMHEMSFLEKLGISPLLVDPKYARETIDNNIAEFLHMKATRFGFAKSRTNALYDVDVNAHRVFLKYADVATQHIHKSPVIAKGRELLMIIPDGEKTFQLKDKSPDVHTAITNWLDTQAGQRRSGLERVLNKQANRLADAGMKALNRNLAFAILSGSIRAALIQPTALLNTAARIGVGYTKSGIYNLFDKEMVNMALEKSKVLLTREYDSTVTEAVKGIDGVLINAKQWTAEKGLWALKTLDMKAAIATWLGAYEKAQAVNGLNPERAARYADDIVTMTQGSAMPSDLAPIQRTTLGKTLTTFQTFTINNWNFLVKEVAGYKNKNVSTKEAWERISTYIVGATLINILFEDILGTNSPLPTPIRAGYRALERGDGLLGASKEIGKEMGQLVPGLGGLRYGSHPLGATVDFAGKLSKEGFTPSNTGKFIGFPATSQIKRWYEGETLQEKAFGKKIEDKWKR